MKTICRGFLREELRCLWTTSVWSGRRQLWAVSGQSDDWARIQVHSLWPRLSA